MMMGGLNSSTNSESKEHTQDNDRCNDNPGPFGDGFRAFMKEKTHSGTMIAHV